MIYWYDTLDSTNNYVRAHYDELDNMSVVAAKYQTKGRGQGDHSWSSESGKNLTFTVLLKDSKDFHLEAKNALVITHITTRAICVFLESLGLDCKIKWPNDIYIGKKKVCGILIENVLKGRFVKYSMVGIGLNLNQTVFPHDLPNPVSVKLLTSMDLDPEVALNTLYTHFLESLAMAKSPQGLNDLESYFSAHLKTFIKCIN